jgi:two-component system, NtrC family, nitrogen regulation sensor histidine kinase NtrY
LRRIRTRLIIVFAAATLAPLAVTLWITTTLLDRSLSLSAMRELDQISRSLETTGRALYQSAREGLAAEVRAGRAPSRVFATRDSARWPDYIREFQSSKDSERFRHGGVNGETVEYIVRRGGDVLLYSKPIGGPGMRTLAREYSNARDLVYRSSTRDLRKGFLYTMIITVTGIWIASLIILIGLARRISRPLEELTAGLSQVASGNLDVRVKPRGHDEVGVAVAAFNHTTQQLQHSRERLVHVTRLASWQSLARKMAHEVKNSLTPIRLTMEELIARKGERDERFLDQAAQIVVDEVVSLERRVRAFSDFAAEPPVRISPVNINELIEERIALLKAANPGVVYRTQLAPERAIAAADEDLVKGVLTNLLENAAHAAGPGGVVLGKTSVQNGRVAIEVHDSGPGLSALARNTLFEPTISFKEKGMGLGLSIAKRSALLLSGDLLAVDGELGGAGFRVVLPRAANMETALPNTTS